MTHRTLHEAVNILRNTKLGATVKLVVSRQVFEPIASHTSASHLPREIIELNGSGNHHDDEEENVVNNNSNNNTTNHNRSNNNDVLHYMNGGNDEQEDEVREVNFVEAKIEEKQMKRVANGRRQLLTFEIPLNETGSAGLGVSVKGTTRKIYK